MTIINIIFILFLIPTITLHLSCIFGFKGLNSLVSTHYTTALTIMYYLLWLLPAYHVSDYYVYTMDFPFLHWLPFTLELTVGITLTIFATIFLLLHVTLTIIFYIFTYFFKDAAFTRFTAFIGIFSFSMAVFILNYDTIMTFISWESIGITSVLLISFYNNRPESIRAGLKALIYNRLGDFYLFLYMAFGLHLYNQSVLPFFFMLNSIAGLTDTPWTSMMIIYLLISAWAKSAQLAFQPWLLDAMEGPTPVSALLHSATLITAGSILLYKFSPMIELLPTGTLMVLLLASISCLVYALCSLHPHDIKRIVAYSTAVHISLMIYALFLTVSCMNFSHVEYNLSVLHLFFHGWIKSLLFMLVGYLIAYIHTQDIRDQGLPSYYLNIFSFLFIVTVLLILGFPGSSLGYSKDVIFDFGYISIYGSALLYPILCILVFSQGYALALALHSYLAVTRQSLTGLVYQHYKRFTSLLSFYVPMVFLLTMCIIIPSMFNDVFFFHYFHPSLHTMVFIDVFSVSLVLGFFLSYFHWTHSHIVSLHFFISTSRFYFDKIFSSCISYFSAISIYTSFLTLEYGFFLSFLNIIVILFLLLLLSSRLPFCSDWSSL